MSGKQGGNPEAIIKEIRRVTRRKFSAEEKIRIVLEAGKKRLQGDTVREATNTEVIGLRQENELLKQLVAELSLKNRLYKKNLTGLE